MQYQGDFFLLSRDFDSTKTDLIKLEIIDPLG